jgi:hypothetical protein
MIFAFSRCLFGADIFADCRIAMMPLTPPAAILRFSPPRRPLFHLRRQRFHEAHAARGFVCLQAAIRRQFR